MKNVALTLGAVATIGALSELSKKGSMAFAWTQENIEADIERQLRRLLGPEPKLRMAQHIREKLRNAARQGPEAYNNQLQKLFVRDRPVEWYMAAKEGQAALERVKAAQEKIYPKVQAELDRIRGLLADLREENEELRARIKELEG